jgi:CheY-like chemotaxis protein
MAEEAKAILVVDDDDDIRDFLRSLLRTEGYRTEGATSGREGIEMAVRLKPDLILLDIMMPQLDGYEVCWKLKSDRATAQIPIVMVTVKNDVADISRSLTAGAVGFIVKPFESDSLLQMVRMVLTGRPFDPYANVKPVAEKSAPKEWSSPNERVVFLNVLEPGGRKSIFYAAAETPGNQLLSLWQEPCEEGVVRSTAACLTSSSAHFDALLGVIANRPTVKILDCHIYDSSVVRRQERM